MRRAMFVFILGVILVTALLIVVSQSAGAVNDSCVIHNGRELRVNHNAVPAHLAHGDVLCAGQPTATPTAIVGPPPNPITNLLSYYFPAMFGNHLY